MDIRRLLQPHGRCPSRFNLLNREQRSLQVLKSSGGLSAVVAATVVLLAVACSGRIEESTPPDERRQGPVGVGIEDIFGSPPSAAPGDEAAVATPLIVRWIDANGEVISLSPPTSIFWPEELEPSDGSIELTINTPRSPDRAYVNLFPAGLDSVGAPSGVPRVVGCAGGESACSVSSRNNQTVVQVEVEDPDQYAVLPVYAEWLLDRDDQSRYGMPSLALSWAFAIKSSQ